MGKQIEVYVQVAPITIYCHSRILDEMDKFTQFIIWAIGNGYTEQQIIDVVQLDSTIVQTALADLENWKFAVKDTDQEADPWQLTDDGEEYYALIMCMDHLENKGFSGYIELHSGVIELDVPEDILQGQAGIPKAAVCIDKKIPSILFRNDNYSNSQEVIKERLQQESLLGAEYMESIYTTIRVQLEKTKYRKYVLDGYDLMECHRRNDEMKNDIILGIPIVKYSLRKKFNALDPYRSVVDTLKNLKIYEQCMPIRQKLLTDDALAIVETYEEEQKLLPLVQYIDEYSGEYVDASEQQPEQGFLSQADAEREKIMIVPSGHYKIQINQASEYRYERAGEIDRYIVPVAVAFEDLHPVNWG